ncbi:MAG: M23 family metallopeptidase [Ignavibacteria bacterium]|jgi:murein DD-endopeptidase MepM/ murein hydrolase activator NlpD|nr:M23 family metallopeptidase [Ignavibacteria bacterium]
MKKFYYFSKSKLQFVEIQNHKQKFLYTTLGIFAVSIVVVFLGIYLYNQIFNSYKDLTDLRKENFTLKQKISEITDQYTHLDEQLQKLIVTNNDLRIAANLPPLTNDERLVGTGGGSFDNFIDFLKTDDKKELQTALSKINEVSRKVAFEKDNFQTISVALKNNEALFSSLPAIKPSKGVVGTNGFGFRYHPILRINRMHDGIDIITDVGTDVFAPGSGTVEYVGSRNGFGLTVEINHGFGYRTIFAHLSKVLIKEGMKVDRGKLIAKTGNSGLSSGPHLHYEVLHKGINKNPEEFFFDDIDLFQIAKKN